MQKRKLFLGGPVVYEGFVGWARTVALAGLFGTLWLASDRARADYLDLALGSLRVECSDQGDAAADVPAWCPDDSRFRSLMSEFGGALLPAVNLPARSLGQRGFYVGVDTTITDIHSGDDFWERGVKGAGDSVDTALIWNRVGPRKGLPFGFELGASLGRALNARAWSLGADLKWSLFEGFRTGWGQMPDVSIRGAVDAAVGFSQVQLIVPSFDVVLSKPFVLGLSGWTLSPYLGVQTGWIFADSEIVDLTPEDNAFDQCAPPPGEGPLVGSEGHSATVCSANGDARDTANNGRFQGLRETRWRISAGGQFRYGVLTLTSALLFDLSSPTSTYRQVVWNLGMGFTY